MKREEIKNQLWEIVTLYKGTLEERYKFFDLLKKYREDDLLLISLLKVRKSKLRKSINDFEDHLEMLKTTDGTIEYLKKQYKLIFKNFK